MLWTGFLNERRSYMTTLRARWEKPDYTGVTAEVPLGHIPHPKIFQKPTAFLLTFVFPGIARLLEYISCFAWSSYGGNDGSSKNGASRFFGQYSPPVSGTRQIPNLAHIFSRTGKGIS
jgi:hypothetical protein